MKELSSRKVVMVEPVSNQIKKDFLSVSLRGSLSQELYDLRLAGKPGDNFVREVLGTISLPEFIALFDEGVLVVGRAKDKGKYFPDW